MIYTDVGCCCSLFDVVSSVVFSFCQQVSKQIVWFFFFVLFFVFLFSFFFFFSSLSLSPILLFSLSLFPFFVDFPHILFFFFFFFFIYLFIYLFIYFFPFFFLLSLSCFLCPLVLSVTVWLSKRVYKIKLIN